ncbi:hypothetical protein U0070_004068 [Myodes glareolus]|uniref:Trafficking protein particle complex 6B n=1 Tax=Myodes glareolus TaxID=447135 RepID=A0AAW0KAG1_MYOGA
MADEALFLLLHNEMVSGVYKSAEQGEVGIYVLQDNKFRLLTQLSAGKQYLEHASKYLAFTCGLIRGGLSNLGIKSIVTAEVSSMPACKFVHLTCVLHHFFRQIPGDDTEAVGCSGTREGLLLCKVLQVRISAPCWRSVRSRGLTSPESHRPNRRLSIRSFHRDIN